MGADQGMGGNFPQERYIHSFNEKNKGSVDTEYLGLEVSPLSSAIR